MLHILTIFKGAFLKDEIHVFGRFGTYPQGIPKELEKCSLNVDTNQFGNFGNPEFAPNFDLDDQVHLPNDTCMVFLGFREPTGRGPKNRDLGELDMFHQPCGNVGGLPLGEIGDGFVCARSRCVPLKGCNIRRQGSSSYRNAHFRVAYTCRILKNCEFFSH